MVFDQPIKSITERNIQALIDEQRVEQKTVEYKRSLPSGTDADKKEFLADASSLANTAGGYLFYGIEEQAGIPTKLPGVQLDDVDAQTLRLENILRDGIAPRLPRIDIHAVALTSKPGYYVLILHIGKSWLFPHRVIFKDHGHFYARNSAGKYSLDVTELRTAFELSGTTAERIRNFRAERLSRVETSEDIPALLDERAPKLVLHVIPFTAFSTLVSFDLSPLYDAVKGPLLRPLVIWDAESHVKMRFNVDGIVRSNENLHMRPPTTIAYTQIFRNGIIETSDTSILGINAWNANQLRNEVDIKSFHGERYERKILEAVKRYIEVEKLLNVDPPFFIMVSFLGVKGYRITDPSANRNFPLPADEIDRINLIIPESIIDTFDADLAEAMKPIFDTVWNAAGFAASPNYDASGKFRFGY